MIAADAMQRFPVRSRDDEITWEDVVLHHSRLGGVPRSNLTTLVETRRALSRFRCSRVELAYLLSELVAADPDLVETVTLLAAAASRAVPAATLYNPVSIMIEAVAHLRDLNHDELTIARALATTWRESPIKLAEEARSRRGG